jgi:RNA polymerase sigma factor (sigma-70 family)
MTGRVNRLLVQLRRARADVTGESRTDGQLLECFVSGRDEAAFAALLRRHGPMVLGVCRRLLGNLHDAEDAFQAVFLVLVRKAGSVRPREAVGNFLYGVAYRTALEARSRIARQRARERQVPVMPPRGVERDDPWAELLPLLDRELHRLPDKYRLPVVLCDIEGQSRREVARRLAIPEGTLSSRLATARRRLAGRLTRLGFALPGAALAALLAEKAAPACVPGSLLETTARAAMLVAAGQAAAGAVPAAAAALTEGVLRAMFLAKVKTVTVVLLGAAALGLGSGGLLYQARAGGQAGGGAAAGQQEDRARRAAEEARARLEAEKQRDKAEAALREAREQLEAARREAEALRAEAQNQRDRAEAARRQEERAHYAAQVSQAQREFEKADPNRRQQGADPRQALNQRKTLADLEAMEATLREKFKAQRDALMTQLRKLEEHQQQDLAKLQQARNNLLREQAPSQAGQGSAGGGDKLDRILERLERLERRLDRLERGRPQPEKKQ